jgi:hypothetical protein
MVSLCLYVVRLRLSVSAAKTAIGAAAAGLVNDGDTVFIDVGTTTPAANRPGSFPWRGTPRARPSGWRARPAGPMARGPGGLGLSRQGAL